MSAHAYLLGAVGILTQGEGWGKALKEGLFYLVHLFSNVLMVRKPWQCVEPKRQLAMGQKM